VSAARRVLISGGSIGGLSAAVHLQTAGWQPTVLERAARPLAGRGAGIVLHPATLEAFADDGSPDIRAMSVSTPTVRYLDADGGIAHERSARFWFSSYDALYRGLLARLGPSVCRFGEAVEQTEQDALGVTATLLGGEQLRGDLLVCAEGIGSSTRRRLLPDVRPRYAGYVAWRGTIESRLLEPSHAALLRDAITYYVLPHGHLLVYPIPTAGEQSSAEHQILNWVWYVNVEDGPELAQLMTDARGVQREISLSCGLVPQESIDALNEAAQRELPEVLSTVIAGTACPFIQAVFDLESPRMVFGRICLIGDAAFTGRPHAAAGSAKAAEDGSRLARALSAGDELETALAAWESRQLMLGRSLLARTRDVGQRSQFEGSWSIGDELPFGLYRDGDSIMEQPR
jgi:2,6-dihydroxypyridine 3-monooxygenase